MDRLSFTQVQIVISDQIDQFFFHLIKYQKRKRRRNPTTVYNQQMLCFTYYQSDGGPYSYLNCVRGLLGVVWIIELPGEAPI